MYFGHWKEWIGEIVGLIAGLAVLFTLAAFGLYRGETNPLTVGLAAFGIVLIVSIYLAVAAYEHFARRAYHDPTEDEPQA